MPKGPLESNSCKKYFLQFFTYNSKTIKYFKNRFFAFNRNIKGLQSIVKKIADKFFLEVNNKIFFFINHFLIFCLVPSCRPGHFKNLDVKFNSI